MTLNNDVHIHEQEGSAAPGAPTGGLLVFALLRALLLLLLRRPCAAVHDLDDDDGLDGLEQQRRHLLAAAVVGRGLGRVLQLVHLGQQPHDRLADLAAAAAAGHAQQRRHDLVIPLPFEAPEQQQVV